MQSQAVNDVVGYLAYLQPQQKTADLEPKQPTEKELIRQFMQRKKEYEKPAKRARGRAFIQKFEEGKEK